nr:helix-turn-helix domain-containing protein [Cellulosimicrobium arenosum]
MLALLPSRPTWTGPELAGRLGVTTRTVRNDVERLRLLGYEVRSTPGATGADALRAALVSVPAGGPTVDPQVLTDVATAVRDRVGLRVEYRSHDGSTSLRAVG